MNEEPLITYTLQVVGPDAPIFPILTPSMIREAEENLTDLLPAGYSVRIREWDEADESWRSGLWRNTQ